MLSPTPGLFDALFSGLLVDDVLVRTRSADAIEKITVRHPEYLCAYRRKLLDEVARIEQKEVRWHVAQMLPRIRWSRIDQGEVTRTLREYLNDRSSIVKAFAMQALVDMVQQVPGIRQSVERDIRKLTRIGMPAMKARGRRLLARLAGPARRSSR